MKRRTFSQVLPAVLIIITILLTSCGSESVEKETGIILSSLEEEEQPVTDTETATLSEPDTATTASTFKADEPVDEEKTAKEESLPVPVSDDYLLTMDGHFGFMPAFYDYASAKEAGGIWTRPHFEMFTWGWIEREQGTYTFMETDQTVQEAQRYGFHILANVQPRALWDEEKCHETGPTLDPGMPAHFTEAHKPCDMEAYNQFVTALVERYDGDGIDDMPGLTVPVKHWEIMNEPEFEMYFLGTPEEYVEIVEASATAIRSADPDAVVVQGGMAGMDRQMTDFWQQVIDLGVMEYFDIYNMHSIGHGEHLNIPAFKQFLSDNGISGKPIWVTEVQYQQSDRTTDFTPEEFAATMARSYIFSLANGVDKLLYVNLKMPEMPPKPQNDDTSQEEGTGGPPFDERSALIDDNGMKTPMFYAHQTISDILGALDNEDEITVISETIVDWFIENGQYRFTINGQTVYALWGDGTIPGEIQGMVTVTDISGESLTMDISELELTDSPVFVQVTD